MTIAVIGAGAIGSIVAGYLKKAGEDVVLIGHSDQVDAIKKNGLVIKSARGSEKITLPVLRRLDKSYDLAVFSVKTQDVENAYQENSDFLEKSLILTTQNGVQADNILSSHFEKEQVVSSIVMFGATYIKPGEVTLNFPGTWIIGKPFASNDPQVYEVVGIFKKAFSVVVTDDIVGMKWLKLFVNLNNCLPALIGKSMQETFADKDFCRLSILLLKEGLDVVNKAGIQLVSLPDFPKERIAGLAAMPLEQGAEIVSKTLTGLSKEPLYGSILQSILRRKTSEIDFINGELAQLARHLKIDAALNSKVVDMVHEVENRGSFFKPDEIKTVFHLN